MADHTIWGWHGLCFRAMNTGVEIQLYTNGTSHALDDIQRMFQKAENCLTRFDPTSELCKLNRSSGRPLRVSPLLFDVVETALWASSATDGLFDPTLLQLMKAIGYDRSFEQIERVDRAVPLLPPPQHKTYQKIRLDRVRREICLPPDAALDIRCDEQRHVSAGLYCLYETLYRIFFSPEDYKPADPLFYLLTDSFQIISRPA